MKFLLNMEFENSKDLLVRQLLAEKLLEKIVKMPKILIYWCMCQNLNLSVTLAI